MRRFLMSAGDDSGTPPRRHRKALTMSRLPKPMQAMCPHCQQLCICQGTVKTDEVTIQNRRCPTCGHNVRLYIRPR